MTRQSIMEGRRPRIGIVCISAIADDPRVRRQGDLFHARGWDVIAIGLPGARSLAPEWSCLAIEDPALQAQVVPAATEPTGVDARLLSNADGASNAAPGQSPRRAEAEISQLPLALKPQRRYIPAGVRSRWGKYAGRLARVAVRRAARVKDILLVYASSTWGATVYWRLNDRFARVHQLASAHRADIWLANDWNALPIVRKLAAEQGVPYAYDTHELAVDEYAHRLDWRLLQRPVIAAVERQGIAGAAVTSCVSQGIADRLHELYGLPEKPLLIRNMPRYEAHPHRTSGETVEVLYHGVVNVGRGLETCIDSVALWRPEFRLTIRGPAPAGYLDSLTARIELRGLGDRVVLAPPVPMTELVRAAARFDVGLFALPGHSQQNVHVLPNKFFEYAMAGLALCVSDLPEMTALLRQYDLGRLIPEVTPEAIAAAINGFDRAGIDACKARSLAAAKALNWEAEAGRMFEVINRAVGGRAAAAVELAPR